MTSHIRQGQPLIRNIDWLSPSRSSLFIWPSAPPTGISIASLQVIELFDSNGAVQFPQHGCHNIEGRKWSGHFKYVIVWILTALKNWAYIKMVISRERTVYQQRVRRSHGGRNIGHREPLQLGEASNTVRCSGSRCRLGCESCRSRLLWRLENDPSSSARKASTQAGRPD